MYTHQLIVHSWCAKEPFHGDGSFAYLHVLAEIINNNLDRELLYGDCKSFLKMRDP